jgi:hypothetical protein
MKSIGLKHEIFANVAGVLCLKDGLMIEDSILQEPDLYNY